MRRGSLRVSIIEPVGFARQGRKQYGPGRWPVELCFIEEQALGMPESHPYPGKEAWGVRHCALRLVRICCLALYHRPGCAVIAPLDLDVSPCELRVAAPKRELVGHLLLRESKGNACSHRIC